MQVSTSTSDDTPGVTRTSFPYLDFFYLTNVSYWTPPSLHQLSVDGEGRRSEDGRG